MCSYGNDLPPGLFPQFEQNDLAPVNILFISNWNTQHKKELSIVGYSTLFVDFQV